MNPVYGRDDCSVCGLPMPCPETLTIARSAPGGPERPGPPCSDADCDESVWARGLCSRHYNRARYVETHPDARPYQPRTNGHRP